MARGDQFEEIEGEFCERTDKKKEEKKEDEVDEVTESFAETNPFKPKKSCANS